MYMLEETTNRCFNCSYWGKGVCNNGELIQEGKSFNDTAVASWIEDGGYQELLYESGGLNEIVENLFELLRENDMLKKKADINKLRDLDEYDSFLLEAARLIDDNTCVGIKNNAIEEASRLTINEDKARDFCCNKWR